MKRRVLVTFFVLAAIIVSSAIAPAFAYSSLGSENVKRFVFFGGDSGEIDLPDDFPLNVEPWKADKMMIMAKDIVWSNAYAGDEIEIVFHCPGLGGAWVPWALLCTSIDADSKVWRHQLNTGLPPEDPQNIKLLPNDVVVTRHGNRISIVLKTAQTLKAGIPKVVYFTLPAFSLTLKIAGCLEYNEEVHPFTGWPRASGWTLYKYELAFGGNGAFTCPEWGYNAKPIDDCAVIASSLYKFVPP